LIQLRDGLRNRHHVWQRKALGGLGDRTVARNVDDGTIAREIPPRSTVCEVPLCERHPANDVDRNICSRKRYHPIEYKQLCTFLLTHMFAYILFGSGLREVRYPSCHHRGWSWSRTSWQSWHGILSS